MSPAQAVVSTGKGYKILVPVGQTIDRDHLNQLLSVAATQKATVALEGSAWTAGAHTVAPARRLRHAILAPRLIAPHRNADSDGPLDPNEAIALLALGRSAELAKFTEKQESVPTLGDAASSKDWRWRFVAAFGRSVADADYDFAGLASTIDDAPSPECRTVAAVVTACSLMDREKHEEAETLLTGQLDEDDASPIDHAWLLVQRARVRAELGQIAEARQDAAGAQRALVGDPDDPTASAIGSSAAWILFRTAAPGSRTAKDVVEANDTAISWWRMQHLAHGLTDALSQSFAAWSEDSSGHLGGQDAIHDRLRVAVSGRPGGDASPDRARSSQGER